MSRAYKKAGVDIVKVDALTSKISKWVRPTLSTKVKKIIGGYAGLYQINKNQYLAATTDGVGTKLKLAIALKQHHTVGIDLVAMSVNDLICVGATPLFFLDYYAMGKLNLKISEDILKGIVEGCKMGELSLIGGESSEMPGMYHDQDYDLAGFAVGMVDKKDIIDGREIISGDLIIGLESSGPHSNGFSLIRKWIKPSEKSLLKLALEPTRIYVKLIQMLREEMPDAILGMAHITGSGFLNIPRIHPDFDYEINISYSHELNEVFKTVIERSKMSLSDAYQTFNMGFGLALVVSEKNARKFLKLLQKHGERATILGQVVRKKTRRDSEVRIYTKGKTIVLR